MLIRHRNTWDVAERDCTPEAVFLNRRALLAGAAATGAALALPRAGRAAEADPSASLYPAKRNPAYTIQQEVTPEKVNTTYNNFYEFGTSKHVSEEAESLRIRPWTVSIEGLVETPRKVAIDDLLKAMPLEERLYRHRCVEAWSMAVPWTGFPVKALIDYAKPLASAKFIALTTFLDPDMAPGQNSFFYNWPYVEGLTMEEGANDLAFMVTGAYGKPLPKVMGAPLRLALPWKYGFKSAKSIVKVKFVEKMPSTTWNDMASNEYGFYSNVNPNVDHPRWSQKSERVIGAPIWKQRKPTLMFNGYGDQVASLYTGMDLRKNF